MLLEALDTDVLTALEELVDCLDVGVDARDLQRVFRLREALLAKSMEPLQAFDELRLYQLSKASSTAQFLERCAGLSPGDAHFTVVMARKLKAMPRTEAAWLAGTTSSSEVRAIVANVHKRLAEQYTAEEADVLAIVGPLDAKSTAKAMQRWAATPRPRSMTSRPRRRATTSSSIRRPLVAGSRPLRNRAGAKLLDGPRIDHHAYEALFCTAQLLQLVLDEHGAIRSYEMMPASVTDALFGAIAARDQHCHWPGCHKKPIHCDIHHLHYRGIGGPNTPSCAAPPQRTGGYAAGTKLWLVMEPDGTHQLPRRHHRNHHPPNPTTRLAMGNMNGGRC